MCRRKPVSSRRCQQGCFCAGSLWFDRRLTGDSFYHITHLRHMHSLWVENRALSGHRSFVCLLHYLLFNLGVMRESDVPLSLWLTNDVYKRKQSQRMGQGGLVQGIWMTMHSNCGLWPKYFLCFPLSSSFCSSYLARHEVMPAWNMMVFPWVTFSAFSLAYILYFTGLYFYPQSRQGGLSQEAAELAFFFFISGQSFKSKYLFKSNSQT